MTNAFSNYTILIAEDHEDTRSLLRMMIEHVGFRVLEAGDGKMALDMVRSRRPDLLVVDIMMPEFHGLTVCHQVKTDPATQNIKVIVVSVKNYPADQEQAYQAGADLFMGKPLEEEAFILAIKKLLKIPS